MRGCLTLFEGNLVKMGCLTLFEGNLVKMGNGMFEDPVIGGKRF